jgi:hypothetical protein
MIEIIIETPELNTKGSIYPNLHNFIESASIWMSERK